MSGYMDSLYWWVRDKDETGMSGLGKVAQVAVFEDGSAVLRWVKRRNSAGVQSTVFYERVEDLVHVHGHGERKTGHLELIGPLPVDVCLVKMRQAIDALLAGGLIEGGHHKQWAIENALKVLLGERYQAVMELPEMQDWERGIAP